MKIHTKSIITLIISLIACCASIEAEDFTPAEKAQINIPTPGLFSKSKTFTVDFTSLRESEYSFPLPVGKARASGRGLTITTTRGDAVKAMFAGTVRLSRNIPQRARDRLRRQCAESRQGRQHGQGGTVDSHSRRRGR